MRFFEFHEAESSLLLGCRLQMRTPIATSTQRIDSAQGRRLRHVHCLLHDEEAWHVAGGEETDLSTFLASAERVEEIGRILYGTEPAPVVVP